MEWKKLVRESVVPYDGSIELKLVCKRKDLKQLDLKTLGTLMASGIRGGDYSLVTCIYMEKKLEQMK